MESRYLLSSCTRQCTAVNKSYTLRQVHGVRIPQLYPCVTCLPSSQSSPLPTPGSANSRQYLFKPHNSVVVRTHPFALCFFEFLLCWCALVQLLVLFYCSLQLANGLLGMLVLLLLSVQPAECGSPMTTIVSHHEAMRTS